MNKSLKQLSSNTTVVVHTYNSSIQEAETEGWPQLWDQPYIANSTQASLGYDL